MEVSPIHWEYANLNYAGVAQDLKSVKEKLKILENQSNTPVLKQEVSNSIFEENQENSHQINFEDIAQINPVTKAISKTSELIKKKEYTPAFLIASQAALDLPNVIDDTIDAIDLGSKFIKSGLMHDKRYVYMYKKAYDWKKAQHPFSYFRGTLLKNIVNPNHPKCPTRDVADWLTKQDKSLLKTQFGDKVIDFFNLNIKKVKTNIKSTTSTPQKPVNIKTYQFIVKSKAGKIVARSMTRIPVIGLATSGLVEAIQVANDIREGEKAVKAIGKGVARFTSSTAITAVLGAVGAMAAGPVGSLAGIVIAGFINNKIAKAIN